MSRSFIVDSRPAIAKLWPSRNSMVVRASRLVSDGTVKPEIWYGLREVELAHRRRQTQIDDAVSQNRRHERQLHAERLVVDGDDRHAAGAPRLHDRYRKFAARQEGGGVTGERNQVRLGQSADEALRFQCRQSDIEAGPFGGETGQRDAKGLRTRDQSRRSSEYRKARCPTASGRTWRGYRISACVNTGNCRPAPRADRAHPGRESLGFPRCLPQTNSPRVLGSRCGRPQEIGP